jgi:hypothetical protein
VRAGRGERLDGVVLQRLQVVEAVEEDRCDAPGGGLVAQGVQRGRLVERRVHPAQALQAAPVGRVQAADLVGVGAAAVVVAGPGAQGLGEALRRDAQRLELVDEAQQLAGEAARARGGGERPQRRGGDDGRGDALAREPAQRAAGHAAASRALLDEPGEAHDLRAEDDAVGGELGAVALDVGERRHDEDRILAAAQRRAVAVEDDLRLLGVGGTGDELERHPSMVARRPDDVARASAARAYDRRPWRASMTYSPSCARCWLATRTR